jgi:hypothetical protein
MDAGAALRVFQKLVSDREQKSNRGFFAYRPKLNHVWGPVHSE